jgi:hypothetical protein
MAWSRAAKMKAEKMAAENMAAERAKAERTTAGRATAKREVADGLEKRAETDWKLASSLTWGVGWVETTATAWMATIRTAAVSIAMAYRMRVA